MNKRKFAAKWTNPVSYQPYIDGFATSDQLSAIRKKDNQALVFLRAES